MTAISSRRAMNGSAMLIEGFALASSTLTLFTLLKNLFYASSILPLFNAFKSGRAWVSNSPAFAMGHFVSEP